MERNTQDGLNMVCSLGKTFIFKLQIIEEVLNFIDLKLTGNGNVQ